MQRTRQKRGGRRSAGRGIETGRIINTARTMKVRIAIRTMIPIRAMKRRRPKMRTITRIRATATKNPARKSAQEVLPVERGSRGYYRKTKILPLARVPVVMTIMYPISQAAFPSASPMIHTGSPPSSASCAQTWSKYLA